MIKRIPAILRIAYRNGFRPQKNIIIIASVVVASMMLCFVSSIVEGIKSQLHTVMKMNYTGDALLVNNAARIRSGAEPLMVNWDECINDDQQIESIQQTVGFHNFRRRLVSMAGLMGGDNDANIYLTLIGCEILKEQKALKKHILAFHEHDDSDSGLWISAKASMKLGLKVHGAAFIFLATEAGIIPAKVQISGIFEGKGFPGVMDNVAYIDYNYLLRMLGISDSSRFSYALIFGDGYKKIDVPEDFKLIKPLEAGKFFYSQKGMYDFFVGITLILMMLSMFLFVYSSMIINVNGRIREIGILKSLGLSEQVIVSLFTSEGLLLGLIPSSIGSVGVAMLTGLISIWGIPAINQAMRYSIAGDRLYPNINIWFIVIIVGGTSFLSMIGAFFSCRRVVQLAPVEALRHQ